MGDTRYILRETSMFIKPILVNDRLVSEVKEYQQEPFIVNVKPMQLIEESCNFYNTSYPARKESTRIIADICQKPPIVLKPETQTFFFPSHSDRVSASYWFNLNMITNYKKGKYNDTFVLMEDGTKLFIPVSFHIINMQFLHAVKLQHMLQQRAKRERLDGKEVDYNQKTMNIYEVLSMYALLENRV